jgi:hypothetical protein
VPPTRSHYFVVGNSRAHVAVQVFHSDRALRREIARRRRVDEEPNDRLRNALGVCYHASADTNPKLCALILLSRAHLGVGVIAHECFHATMRVLAQRGLRTLDLNGGARRWSKRRSKIEELAAFTHEELLREIVNELYAQKFLPA